MLKRIWKEYKGVLIATAIIWTINIILWSYVIRLWGIVI